jgi:hypothetical protein
MINLDWERLSDGAQAALAGKLAGLYGHERSAAAFNALAIDKQQALLIFAWRLRERQLWDAVRRIDNVYGEGGVGMSFAAWPGLESMLRRRKDFTRWFAAHGRSTSGFFERHRPRAALHFIRLDAGEPRWTVHFDLYGPAASVASRLLHIYHEKWRGMTPNWQSVAASLRSDGPAAYAAG